MSQRVKDILVDDFWIMPATPEYKDDGIPYITSKNIKNGIIDFTKVNYISQEAYNSISRNRPILVGDILISMIGTLGETAEVKESYGSFYGQNMFLVRINENKVNKRYFLDFFKSSSVKRALEGKQNQSTQKYLKANHIEDLTIPMLKLDEQKLIAEQLDKLSYIIKLRTDELKKLDELIKARFVEMFGDIILNDKGWKTDTWSNALKIVNGKNQKAVESDDGEYLICGSGGAMGRATEYLTNENSVIIGRKGSINKPLLMREKYWNVDTAFGIEPNRKYINVDYLYMFCVFFNFEQLNKAVTIPSLTKADLLNIEMPIPNILLQEQFADFVKQVEKSKFMKSF